MGDSPPQTIVAATAAAQSLLAERASTPSLWRHVILQALDDYESDLRLHGLGAARDGVEPRPVQTGDQRLDAALAALVEHLARRDGWPAPRWTAEPARVLLEWWFIDQLDGLRACALRDSPLSFRKRGIFVGAGGLERA